MKTRRVGSWLWTSVLAAAAIGCGGEDGAPAPKPGPPPEPPADAKKLFEKPARPPSTKPGASRSLNPGWDRTLLAEA